MALPVLTQEQRADALARAARARTRRAEVKVSLKNGSMRLSEFLDAAKDDEVLGKMKVVSLLQSMPRVGATTAGAVMAEVGISSSRRVRGLGAHQRAELVRRFG
ncbi:30S ribosomal protein S13 [Actinomyces radicidentis]|uniref:30S ribosomal protein S13 n=1 Tax=Actinomyces radicidentis TaxID=111015 RepID=A0A0X8JFZ9_ACTRD|nr:integration host factor, actinobacterial type [Actinomyces radicidentis]AMD87929.1 30S ribosomal protein S13 [Actinomyces radicidentis]